SGENPTLVNHYINSSGGVNHRLVINKKAYSDIVSVYNNSDLDKKLQDKIEVVENAIAFNEEELPSKKDKIKIGFVGRWSKEKRPEIFLEIASKLKKAEIPVDFVMAGIGMKSNINLIHENGVSFVGEITEDYALKKFYKSLTFILITSSREGFPMVIIEAMANGVIPICTNVGGISEHIHNYQNGILIDDSEVQDEIVAQYIKEINNLLKNESLISELSLNAYNYSRNHFDIKTFNKKYRKYLLNET
ncbi:glycosyltransferase family 4 protein, partial [Flavobacteriaceae bacterium]|nr:glycosyltransferase family 4 protein [Flavobacteriaceae bacterium]